MTDNRQKLLRQLPRFGYTLFEPDTRPDPNEVLAEMVKSHDARILEGFPVVLANILAQDKKAVDVTKLEKRLRLLDDRRLVRELLAISAQLFRLYNVPGFDDPSLNRFATRNVYDEFIRQNSVLEIFGLSVHPERLRNTFRNYYQRDLIESRNKERAFLHEQFQTEYYLSQLLSPKQKELLMKKLHGEKMTKTEKEYFSRTVRKKLVALADPDLHRMAQKALK